MAKVNPSIAPDLVIVMDGAFVQSMSIGDEALPLNHILGYAIQHNGAMDHPTVTVTFVANPIIRRIEKPDSYQAISEASKDRLPL